MTYYTEFELRRSAGLTASAARMQLKEAARSASGTFDVFLSHSVLDGDVILGLKNLLETQRLRVYVDWIDDPELDRSRVSAATADRIRRRMASSRSLVYATSRAASRSRWMPWELGYFDGTKGSDQISICPIEPGSSSHIAFVGEEYLGLYKTLEKVTWDGVTRPSAVQPSRRQAQLATSFAGGRGNYSALTG
ncbi:hypothetical protein BH18ACT9_BH18ACT9_05420 [soil metagenome]